MSIDVARTEPLVARGVRARWAERRRLKRLDALGPHLAELHAIRALLVDAAALVSRGWVQGAWFTIDDGQGTRVITAYDVGMAADHPISGACLVGAVVQAGGGPRQVRSQLVQRTLDLTWHALREDPAHPVRWCPGPAVRTMHVLELTYWNDAPGRTSDQVTGLLRSAARTADTQMELCHAEQAQLAGV